METTARIHATTLALQCDGTWRAVALRGPPGSGKSDLALRAVEAGARLVADDQTVCEAEGDVLWARAPDGFAGKLEVRGVGIVVEVAQLDRAPLALVCDLCALEEVPRLPARETAEIGGVSLPRLRLFPFEISSVIKLRLGLEAATRDILGS